MACSSRQADPSFSASPYKYNTSQRSRINKDRMDKRNALLTRSKGLLKIRKGEIGWKKVAEITPNPNTRYGTTPAELIFAWKIISDFYKILPERKSRTSRNISINKYFNPGEKYSSLCTERKRITDFLNVEHHWKDIDFRGSLLKRGGVTLKNVPIATRMIWTWISNQQTQVLKWIVNWSSLDKK